MERWFLYANHVFRQFIPFPQDCTILTWRNAPQAFAYLPLLFLLAYLARRRDTYFLRLLLLPIALSLALRCAFQYRFQVRGQHFADHHRVMVAFYAMAKSVDFALAPHGRLKVGERNLPDSNEPLGLKPGETSHRARGHVPTWLYHILELLCGIRGIGWDFGRDLYVPPFKRPLARRAFLRATALSWLKNLLLVDLSDSCIRLVPGVGTSEGGTIFLPSLSPMRRYLTSTLAHFATGMLIIHGVSIVYDSCTLFSVYMLKQDPADWPPIQGNPLTAASLHDFWAKCWHQGLRRAFMVAGGIPGSWIAGKAGMVIGTFLASGLFHELCTYPLGRGLDHRTTLWFTLQGAGILAETTWKRITGRRVGGILGRLWTAFMILGIGQMYTDAWLSRGVTVVGADALPDALSPARLMMLPMLRQLGLLP